MDNPEVELTVACGYGDVGHRLRPNAVVRAWIIDNGYGKLVGQPPADLSRVETNRIDRQQKVTSKRAQGGGLI
jgi:hypothetical protein